MERHDIRGARQVFDFRGTQRRIILLQRRPVLDQRGGHLAGVGVRQARPDDEEDVIKQTDQVLGYGGDDFSFSSYHTGGAHFLFAGGSVQFISENIDSRPNVNENYHLYGTYQKLGSRNDGQTINGF